MRDINFRVWDRQCRLWLTLAGADWGGVKGRGTFCNFKYIHLFPPEGVPMRNPSPHYGGCLSFKLTDSVDNDRLVFEQYTGLKDKNGTDIYEGDIIQFEFWNEKYYRQIAYNSAIASYEAITVASPTSKKLRQKAKYSFSELYKISSKGFKVVGNIHENPELLEEK